MDNSQLSFAEEEDLNALRMAALQSLKKKGSNEHQSLPFNGSPRGKPKRGKFNRPQQQGRTLRNGQFNGWSRNSNLITVPVLQEDGSVKKTEPQESSKLVLPQDRYCNAGKSEEKASGEGGASKFDRYNNSDRSESESDEETVRSETEEKVELSRSNSLEALMAELETEIQKSDDRPQEEKPKPKPKKRRKISINVESEEGSKSENVHVLKENLKPENRPSFVRQRKWRRPPGQSFVHPPPVVTFQPQPPALPLPPPQPMQSFPLFAVAGYDSRMYVPQPMYEAPPLPQLPPLHVPPPVYERRVSPLSVNTDVFGTPTLAPLSPRSAAFVLENRAIIEKRKRKSYSRSPTPPRFRRSNTPKRMSLSPKRRPLSPSPIRKVLPPTKKPSSVHERLGVKSEQEKASPKEEKTQEVAVDPVLEARRKKFERNVITMTEGVIKLKKEEGEEAKREGVEEAIDEDVLLEGDDLLELDHKVDLFSDEESDSDNEGRFKAKQETNLKVGVLPFTKLINGAKSDVKSNLRPEDKKKEKKGEKRKRHRSRTPVKRSEKTKQLISLGNDSRKIEIKIRNPAKYERAEEKVVEVAKVQSEEAKEASEAAAANEGDLRAQLSRKRAERQKHPLPEAVPSRFLKNTLQGVGFNKSKNTKKVEVAEGKRPIHLRLGTTTSPEAAPGKKSRKQKSKGSQEQVLCYVASFFYHYF